MKRIFIALAVQAALATPILADYLVIRINLSPDSQQSEQVLSSGGPGGMAGGLPGGGGMVMGGKGGAPGVGGAGRGGAVGGRGGQLGGGNAGGQPPTFGRGNVGQGGGLAGGAQPPSFGGLPGGNAPPNFGGGAPGKGGLAGKFRGAGTLPGTGASGGGAPGGGGMVGGDDAVSGGGGGNAPLQQGGAAPEHLAPARGDLFLVATEVHVNRTNTPGSNSKQVVIAHKWGTTVLNPEIALPGRATMQVIKTPSLETRLDSKRREYLESAAKKQYLQFARWMLQNWNLPGENKFSMQAKFEAFLGELNNQSASLSTDEKAKVAALMQVKSQLSQPVAQPKEEMELIRSLSSKLGKDLRTVSKGHYLIYHGPQDDKLAELKLAKLEEAMAGVLYWFALESKPLPMPTKQFVCILADSVDRFKSLRTTFDSLPLNADGFYSPQDNITVLAPQRVDPAFERFLTLANNAESSLRTHKLDFKKMLAENPRKPHLTSSNAQDQEFMATVVSGQIFALAKNAALEEGVVTTATSEAFEQLAGVAGYPPRAVQLPKALRDGLQSFFATPKSSGELNLPSLWTGIGGPHWLYLPVFRKLMDARKNGNEKAEITIHENTAEAHPIKIGGLDIMRVITDRDFRAAEKAETHDRDFLREKAKAEAWSLIYFLLNNKGEQFRAFYGELKEMPRDLELSPEVVEQAFGRAFDLLDAKGEKIDTAKSGRLQSEWTDYMKSVMLEVDTAEKK